jgi:FtsP/CotA-like multicopper oxidase with cupredoxin domain
MKPVLSLLAAMTFCTFAFGATADAASPVPGNGTFGRLDGIASSDGMVSGGSRSGHTLHIALVARWGMWYPDGPRTMGLPIEAFGEAGRSLQIPGPLVHVPLGTRVVASIHNQLPHDLTIRGLASGSAASQAIITVPRGATRHVAFTLDRAGMFYYYGSDFGEGLASRFASDAELSGAIVVDRPHAPPIDRVFLLSIYAPVIEPTVGPNFLYALETINGRSYPATEHLSYERGQHVRWGIANVSGMTHPMHLHGFYFRVDRPGAYDEVTHAFHPGDAEEISWVADRAGTWMFHCHISDHIVGHAPIADMRAAKASPQFALAKDPEVAVANRFHRADKPMGGMVVAIQVRPRPGDRAPSDATAPRQMTLAVDARDESAPPYPGLTKDTLTLGDGVRQAQSSGNAGPPIVLTRGEPVAIAVTNNTRESTSIHWHGIALQNSYYDGGSGMAMPIGQSAMSPAIASNQTFVARFTPPDAGTFMYHAHMDDGWQLASGIYGALIVLPPHQTFDSGTDHVVMISESYERAGSPYVAFNGLLKPPALTVAAGVPQRLRIAVMTLGGENLVASLSDGSHVLQWTPIAKDGRDLPSALRQERVATQALTIGETRDFRFTPYGTGPLELKVYDLDNGSMLVGTQQIDVRR